MKGDDAAFYGAWLEPADATYDRSPLREDDPPIGYDGACVRAPPFNSPSAPPMIALASLRHVTTATLTTVLLKKGLRNVWLRGTKPLRASQSRVAGRAFTLRFIPPREDQATPESWAKPTST